MKRGVGNSRVVILDSSERSYIHDVQVEKEILNSIAEVDLLQCSSVDEAVRKIGEVDILISWHAIPVLPMLIDEIRGCRGIVRAAVGFDNIDIDYAKKLSIPVANVPDYGTEEVADHTLALILSCCRRLNTTSNHCKQGGWEWTSIGKVKRLRGLRLGIVGFGRIGKAVSLRAKPFGFNVGFYDPYVCDGVDKSLNVLRYDTFKELLIDSDIISIHAPLSIETKNMFDAEAFDLIKKGAVVINTARGEIVDLQALSRAVKSGVVDSAGLDVLSTEPSIPIEIQYSDSIILTAHSAFYSESAMYELRQKTAKIAKNFLLGNQVRSIVNGVPSSKEQIES